MDKEQLHGLGAQRDLNEMMPAIDMLMCHAGKSFSEACLELGLDPQQVQSQLHHSEGFSQQHL